MNFFKQRNQLLSTAVAMSKNGLNQGAAGNLSLRLGKDNFLITPSGLACDACRLEDLIVMDMDGNVRRGKLKPSSEWRLHRDIYQDRGNAGAVIHAHSPWCTTLACLERGIPAFHYMVAAAGGTAIDCAPYALFGSQELSDFVLAALSGDRRACLLAHHGMVCYGEDVKDALSLTVEVEHLSMVYARGLQIGDVPLLSDTEMEKVVDKFTDYRKA